jgi:hypothetical protein
MSAPLLRVLGCVWLLLTGIACAPKIGRDCSNSLDCSAQGSRLCDRTQPGGYCTITGCEEGTCPDEAVCVKFRPGQERLAVTYCMATCSVNGDCRDGEGYRCTSAADFGERHSDDAEILGNRSQKFCAIPALMPTALPKAPSQQSREDAGEQPDASATQ